MSKSQHNNTATKQTPESNEHKYVQIFWLASGLLALMAFFQAWAIRWLHDDIFVTLRYVDHFGRGLGVVFNPGERVEGYTHPLWLLFLIVAQALGGDPVDWCVWLGLASYAGVFACVIWLSWKVQPRSFFFLPLTALALAVHLDFRIWATGGLETMFFSFLLCLAVVVYFYTAMRREAKLALLGLILIAAVGARPDAALLFMLANALLLARGLLRRVGAKTLVVELFLFNAALLFLFIPYLAWKVSYYGDLLPNTYYTKSGGGMQVEQGLRYLWTYFRVYWTSALFVVGFPAAIVWIARGRSGTRKRRSRRGKRNVESETNAEGRQSSRPLPPALAALENRETAALSVILLAMTTYLLVFIIRVGGDYMFARMLVPLVPFMYFAIEVVLVRTFRSRPVVLLAAALVLPGVILAETAVRNTFMTPRNNSNQALIERLEVNYGIADEYWVYTRPLKEDSPLNIIQMQRQQGLGLRPFFEGLDVVAMTHAQNVLAYYSRIKTCIGYFGLTDKHVAHQPPVHWRPGHQKQASHEYLLERRTNFYFIFTNELRPKNYQKAIFDTANGPLYGFIYTYDRELLETMKERAGEQFRYPRIEDTLDNYFDSIMSQREPEDIVKDYREFTDYYFRWYDDPEREQVFLDYFKEQDISLEQ